MHTAGMDTNVSSRTNILLTYYIRYWHDECICRFARHPSMVLVMAVTLPTNEGKLFEQGPSNFYLESAPTLQST